MPRHRSPCRWADTDVVAHASPLVVKEGHDVTLVVPDALESPTCRDRDDDVVLATARAAGECARPLREVTKMVCGSGRERAASRKQVHEEQTDCNDE
jgi:hypothetical protein